MYRVSCTIYVSNNTLFGYFVKFRLFVRHFSIFFINLGDKMSLYGQTGLGIGIVFVNRKDSETHERAEKLGFQDAKSLERLCELCSIIICVCPPDAAETVADDD